MFTYCFVLLERLKADRKGVTALEYGVLAAGIVLAVATAATALAGKLTTLFTSVGTAI
jgi:pilus assembly protein Flp/PilA